MHAAAVGDVVAAAQSVPPDRWTAAPAAGKWSAAEIVEHLIAGYELAVAELAGGAGMRLRRSMWRRLFIRLRYLPGILRGDGFPAGAPAPREVRPTLPTDVAPADSLRRLREAAARFEGAVGVARRERPRARITHAYLGRFTPEQALRFCAAHDLHHARQIRAAARATSQPQQEPLQS